MRIASRLYALLLILLWPHTLRAQTAPAETEQQRLARQLTELQAQHARDVSELRAQQRELAGKLEQLASHAAQPATDAALKIAGYAEVFYQWNFNVPSNGITNYRAFDNRRASFTLDNAVIDALGTWGPVAVRIAIQFGETPETYYLSEPVWRGGSVTSGTGPEVWKHIQQANVAWIAPLGAGLSLEAGIFLSPIGAESLAVKDDWNWSRSNLFVGLPFYHTGARVTYPFAPGLTLSLQLYNGWNSVVDNNRELSLAGVVNHTLADKLTWQLVYFSGVERPDGAPEGRAWRHLFDGYVVYPLQRYLSLMLQLDGGFEPNKFGTSHWAAVALSARVQPQHWLYLAVRGDFFSEKVPPGATPIFWNGASWVSSITGTADVRPFENVSFRLEYRHDAAERDLFFQHEVPVNAAGDWISNASTQDTVTLGAVAWF